MALSVLMVTVLWVLLQIGGAFVKIGSAEGTSYWAHLGGFATGILLTFIFRAPDLGQIELGHEVLERMNARGPAAVVYAAQRHLTLHPDDTKVLNDLAEAYGKLNEPTKEADTLLRLLDVSSPDQQPEVIRRLSQIGYVSRIPVLRRLQLADRCKADDPFVAKALYRSVAEGPDDVQTPEALLAWAAVERPDDEAKSDEILSRLVHDFPLHPAVDLARKRGWIA
jgi:hypothetical protein